MLLVDLSGVGHQWGHLTQTVLKQKSAHTSEKQNFWKREVHVNCLGMFWPILNVTGVAGTEIRGLATEGSVVLVFEIASFEPWLVSNW